MRKHRQVVSGQKTDTFVDVESRVNVYLYFSVSTRVIREDLNLLKGVKRPKRNY